MAQDIGELQAIISASYDQLKRAEKISEKAFRNIGKAIEDVEKKNEKYNKKIHDSANNTANAAKKQGQIFGGIGSSVMSKLVNPYTLAATAIVGASVSLSKAIVSVNSEIENSKVKWEVLLGSVADADDRIQELQQFAASTPFQFAGISKASTVLQTFGGDTLATGDNLRKLGDLAAMAQVPIDELGTHFGRLYDAIQSGRSFGESAMRMQELGLLSGEARGQLENMQKAGEDANKMWSYFLSSTSKADGMMGKLSKTWSGLYSTLIDNLTMIFQEASKPLFDEMKNSLEGLLNWVTSNKGTITKFLNEWWVVGARILKTESEIIGSFKDSFVWWMKLTSSDNTMDSLAQKSLMYNDTIKSLEKELQSAISAKEEYSKFDKDMAKNMEFSITQLKKQISEVKNSKNEVDRLFKSKQDLEKAEKGLEEARRKKRERLEAEAKAAAALAEKQKKLKEAYDKVSSKLSDIIEKQRNKTREIQLTGNAQELFNNLISAGIQGEKAYQIALGNTTSAHDAKIKTLAAEIEKYNSMKQTFKDLEDASQAKLDITKGFSSSIKDLEKQRIELQLNEEQLRHFNALISAGLPQQEAWRSVNGEVNSEYAKQINSVIKLTDEIYAMQKAQEELTFSDKMRVFFDDLRTKAMDTAQLVQDTLMSISDSIADSLSNAIIEGKFAWDDMFRTMLADVTNLMVKNLEYRALAGIGGAIYGTNDQQQNTGMGLLPQDQNTQSSIGGALSTITGQRNGSNQVVSLLTSIDNKLGVIAGKEMSVNIAGGLSGTASNLSSPTNTQLASSLASFLGA